MPYASKWEQQEQERKREREMFHEELLKEF
jgi:hypothetical protein